MEPSKLSPEAKKVWESLTNKQQKIIQKEKTSLIILEQILI